jgi:hypothetical protein
VLLAWGSSRALFLIAGVAGAKFLTAVPPGAPAPPPGFLSHWAHWDGSWYAAIAAHGYRAVEWPASTNFFPLYPILIRAGTLLPGGSAFWGVAISLTATLIALYFVYDLARAEWGESVARGSTLALAFFPSSFFMNAVYTEALFLALATGCCWAARVQRNLALAAGFAYFAAMTRNIGVFLVFPLAHEWYRRRQAGETSRPAVALIASPVVGLGGYMFYLTRWTGDPLSFATVARTTWGRHVTNPLHTVDLAWRAAQRGADLAIHPERVFGTLSLGPAFSAMDTANLAFLLLIVALLLVSVSRLPFGLSLYSAAVVALPVLTPAFFSPLASFPRYALSAFPLFFIAGMAISRSRWIAAAWVSVGAAVGVLWTLFFVTGRWVA